MPKTAILDKNKLYPKAVCQQDKEPATILHDRPLSDTTILHDSGYYNQE